VSTVRAEALQWFALLAGALAWAVQLVVGFGAATATCSAAGAQWGVDTRAWILTVTLVAGTVVLLAEAAAVAVLRETSGVPQDGPPPDGRRRFFALAAALGNVLFFVAVVLGGIGSLAHQPCHGS
jgi:hypothetical protein